MMVPVVRVTQDTELQGAVRVNMTVMQMFLKILYRWNYKKPLPDEGKSKSS